MAWVKIGDEVRVDSGVSTAIAAIEGGGFVVGWSAARPDPETGLRSVVGHQTFLPGNTPASPATILYGYDAAREIVLVGQPGAPNGFVVDYVSYARILLNEFIPSVYPGNGELQIDPALTTAGDGNALAFVFYSGGYDIALVVRDPALAQTRVVVNTTTAGAEDDPDVAELADGGFAVAWETGAAIRGRVLTASGGAVGTTPLDFEITAGGKDPSVAALAGGGFVVTWRVLQPGAPADGPGDLMGRLYGSDGVAVGGEIPLAVGIDDQSYPDVTALPGGGFALLWLDSPSGSERTVRIQFFDDAGVADGDPIIVNAGGAAVGPPALAVLEDGSIAVTWTEADGVYTQVLAEADVNVVYGDAGVNALTGTSGMDELTGLGGADTLVGLDGDDSLFGGDGIDTLQGGSGADRLFGGRGADVMSGGTGDDSYSIDDAGDQVLENAGEGYDQITTRTSHTLQAGSEIELLIAAYQAETTALNLTGNGFANTLRGNNGANVLDGGGGADVLQGYLGDDTYLFDSASDQLIEAAGQGNDTLRASVGLALQAAWSIETLQTTDAASTMALNLTGNAGNNRIEGNAGANILDGGGGADVLVGFGGADWYFVDSNDTIIDNSAGNRVFASTDYTLGNGVVADILSTTLHAGTAAINLTGNSFGNTIYGNAGNNRLDGAAGGDRLYGLEGDDTYIVDSTGDQVFESAGGGTDSVRVIAGLTYTLTAGSHVETLRVHNPEQAVVTNIYGNELANTIIGSNSANTLGGGGGNDVLYGFLGDDLLQGGAGDDILHGGGGANDLMGGTGNDWYYVTDARDDIIDGLGEGAADRVYTSVTYTLTEAAQIEILSTADFNQITSVNLTGNSFANVLYGNAGSNFLDGRGGADVMIGLAGDDFYFVDNAADRVTEAAGQGADIVFASVSYVLGAGQHVERLSTNLYTETTAINLTGNELVNNIAGNAGANRLNGGAGKDMLTGLAGADAFLFDTALNTAAGGDWASLGASANVDYITDFDAADRFELDVDVFSALGLGVLSANAFVIGTGAADANDRIIYNSATGALLYDADGVGGAAALQFALLKPGLTTVSADDFHGV